MSRYKVIYKNDGLLFHEHIEAKNIDDLAFRIRYQYGHGENKLTEVPK